MKFTIRIRDGPWRLQIKDVLVIHSKSNSRTTVQLLVRFSNLPTCTGIELRVRDFKDRLEIYFIDRLGVSTYTKTDGGGFELLPETYYSSYVFDLWCTHTESGEMLEQAVQAHLRTDETREEICDRLSSLETGTEINEEIRRAVRAAYINTTTQRIRSILERIQKATDANLEPKMMTRAIFQIPCDNTDCSKVEPIGGKFKYCSGCHRVRYCSRKCQLVSWSRIHNEACQMKWLKTIKNFDEFKFLHEAEGVRFIPVEEDDEGVDRDTFPHKHKKKSGRK